MWYQKLRDLYWKEDLLRFMDYWMFDIQFIFLRLHLIMADPAFGKLGFVSHFIYVPSAWWARHEIFMESEQIFEFGKLPTYTPTTRCVWVRMKTGNNAGTTQRKFLIFVYYFASDWVNWFLRLYNFGNVLLSN